ncbi:hypothetical protein EDB19DRAFT_1912474 [Suillus lakei]|nr:hypothetical protein EDB19DRAFT_1912474 [Suillus lakei]
MTKTKKPIFKRSKNGNAKRSSSETRDSGSNAVQLLGVAITAINTTKDLVPINLAKGILGTLANILIVAQSVIKNKSDFQAIVDMCETIRRVLQRATEIATKDDLQGSLGEALSELRGTVDRIHNEVTSKKGQGLLQRIICVTSDSDLIVGWQKDLDRVLVLFNTEAIVGIALGVKQLTSGLDSKLSLKSVTHRFLHHDLPYFMALIGPGGMGKSSLAKAILNEPPIVAKFGGRRFFVTYDGLKSSTVTLEVFMTRFAGVLGIELAGANLVWRVFSFLHLANALIVLDNAETFQEASGSSVLGEISSAIADIADIPGIVLILTSRSRRNAPNVPWIQKDIPPLDLSSAQETFFRIYHQVSRSNAEEEITHLLKELEFHPLSINLLANAAQLNSWPPDLLLKRWDNRRSKNLGEDGRRALAVVAFLPQGLNDDLGSDLLPSFQQTDINTICDCSMWAISRLSPRQLYQDARARSSLCARFIATLLISCSNEQDNHADIVISDHLNIEHIIASDLAHVPDGTEEIYDVCCRFLWCLQRHHPRPTILTQAIFNIAENSSTWTPKARCLYHLGWLYNTLTQLTESIKTIQAAQVLSLAAGDHRHVALCVTSLAEKYRSQGHFTRSQQVLNDFQNSVSWNHLGEEAKARVWYFLDNARIYTFTVPADELFIKSMEDGVWGSRSKVWHWRAKMYHGGNTVQVKEHLDNIVVQDRDVLAHRNALQGLADVAYCEGRLLEAMHILQKLVDMLEGRDPSLALWTAVWKSAVASRMEDHDLAREIIHKASGQLEFLALRSARTFLHISYGSARVDLAAGEYYRAEAHFNATLEGCDIQGNLTFKAFSTRGLGEVAFVRGNFAIAAERFAETQAVCIEMGVPPRNLYHCLPFNALPDRFQGWALFLEGHSPFTNIM